MNQNEEANSYFKQKRDEYLVDIRKKKNNEQINQKRIKFARGDETGTMDIPPLSELAARFMEAFRDGDLKNLPVILNFIGRAISIGEKPPVAELMQTGIVPHIVELLSGDYYGEGRIIAEASWIAVNIASRESTHVNFLVSLEIIPIAFRLFEYPAKEVNENAIYILANIAGENTGYRDVILEMNVADVLDAYIAKADFDTSMIANIAWLISNLCGRKKPYAPFDAIASFMKYIQECLQTSNDVETLKYTMWSLAAITQGGESEIDEVLQMDIVEDIFKCLKVDNRELRNATLKTIGNIIYESDSQMQFLMNRGLVEAVYPLLHDGDKVVRKQAAFAFCNLLSGTGEQVKEIIDYGDGQVVKTLMEMVNRDHPDVSEECLYALCNACDSGNMQEVTFLVRLGLIDQLVEQLKIHSEVDIVVACLAAVDNILKEGEDMMMGTDREENPFYMKLNECGGIECIEKLQNFPSQTVFDITENIFKRYPH